MIERYGAGMSNTTQNMTQKWNTRLGLRLEYGLGFLICLLALMFALYLEFYKGLEPCPLCILQRVSLLLLGLVYLFGLIQAPTRWGIKLYGLVLLCLSLGGLGVAVDQINIQNISLLHPQSLSACSPGLHYLWNSLAIDNFMSDLFRGDGVCSLIGPKLMGLSLTEWTAGLFLILSLLNLHLVCRDFLLGKG